MNDLTVHKIHYEVVGDEYERSYREKREMTFLAEDEVHTINQLLDFYVDNEDEKCPVFIRLRNNYDIL